MVVDDDADIRSVVGLALGTEGYETVEARDGLDALEQLRVAPHHPSLILLDIMMPRMNGTDVLRAIRADPSFADVPIVVLSGDTQAVRGAIELGANGSVGKPLGLDQLLAAVQRHAHVA